MTRVPLAPPSVGGLINLRGQVITAIDLGHRLGLPPRPAGELPMNVVVRTADGAVSLLVDRIGEVVHASSEDFEAPPETLTGPGRELITGAYKLAGSLLLALDVPRSTCACRLTAAVRPVPAARSCASSSPAPGPKDLPCTLSWSTTPAPCG